MIITEESNRYWQDVWEQCDEIIREVYREAYLKGKASKSLNDTQLKRLNVLIEQAELRMAEIPQKTPVNMEPHPYSKRMMSSISNYVQFKLKEGGLL